MAGVNDIIAFGFGGWSTVNQVPTLGFGVGAAVVSIFAPGDIIYTRHRTSESDGFLFNRFPVKDGYVRSVAAVSDGIIRRAPERVIGE